MKSQIRNASLVAAALCLMASATPAHAGLSLGAKSSGSGGLSLGVPQVNADAFVSSDTQAGGNLSADTNLDANVTINGGGKGKDEDTGRSGLRIEENARDASDLGADPSTNRGHKKRHHSTKPGASQREIHDHATGLENRVDAGAHAGGSASLKANTGVSAGSDVNQGAGLSASHRPDPGLKTDYNQ